MSTPETLQSQLDEAADFIRNRLGSQSVPTFGLVLGTGLGGLVSNMKILHSFHYSEIPHFPRSTVESHVGRLIVGSIEGRPIIVMQGRVHAYEGIPVSEIAFPVQLLRILGVQILVLTNASGGLNPLFVPGDIMAVTDHINFTGLNPLVGPNLDSLGIRFPDMSRVYDRDLLEIAEMSALDARIPLQKGVYVGVLGPSMETPAETRMLRGFGADAVGMSTIPEVIAAVHCGLRVMVIAAISNVNRPDCMEPAPLDTIIANASAAGTKIIRLLQGMFRLLPEEL